MGVIIRGVLYALLVVVPVIAKLITKVLPIVFKWGWPAILSGGLYIFRDAITSGFKHLLVIALRAGRPLISRVAEDFPEVDLSGLPAFMPYINAANYWVPFDYMLQLWLLYFAAFTLVLVYRLVKSWIPGVSG